MRLGKKALFIALSIKKELIFINLAALLLSIAAVFIYPKGDGRPVIILILGIISSILLIFNNIEKEKKDEKERENLEHV